MYSIVLIVIMCLVFVVALCDLFALQWMQESWRTDPCYSSYGVNGSQCSILIYLSEVPKWFQALLSLAE